MQPDFTDQELAEIRCRLRGDAQQTADTPPAETRPMLETISAVALMEKDIPPIRWIVQDLIPAGLTIFASPPKLGKSWAAMDLCLSTVMGRSFLGYRCNKSEVLYLALEDGERRLKSRMKKVGGFTVAPPGVEFSTTAPTLSMGLMDALEDHMKRHPETGLIIVDTLQKVRDVGGSKDVYGRDYNDVGTLKRFADTHNIAMLLIHHLRKMGDEDPFARISGTNGISGAADTMMVLTREKRGDNTFTLSITGRDVEQADLAVKFNRSSCIWENLGDADAFEEQQARTEYVDSPIVRTIKKLLEQFPNGWEGNAQQLLDAGRFIARTPLAGSPRALANKVKKLDELLLEYDGIVHERDSNGSGGGKHKFYYIGSLQFEELEQSEIDPFSEF